MAETASYSGTEPYDIADGDGLYLRFPPLPYLTAEGQKRFPIRFSEAERRYFALGLRLAAAKFAAERDAPPPPTWVELRKVAFAETDFQPEGLAAAVYGLLGKALGFTADGIEVAYNKPANRYDFRWPMGASV